MGSGTLNNLMHKMLSIWFARVYLMNPKLATKRNTHKNIRIRVE